MAFDIARSTVPRDAGLWRYERALRRRGFPHVAGVDEAGRGACAGPLAVAAVVLPAGRRGRVPGLADSKLLTPAAREEVYAEVADRALAWSVVLVPPAEIDRAGLHVCNVAGMRRAVAALRLRPSYVLTDGFPVRGFGAPSLAVWKGDQVVAAIAAASVVAKVTRDRLMIALHSHQPRYDFAQHKGYVTPEHTAALQRHGPCPDHRFSYVNVARTVPRSSSPAVGLPAYAGPRPSRDRLATAAVVGETPPAQWVRHNAVMAEETAT
jgi:ribonuclease HII